MITIYTDGACRNNQSRENIGAWAYYAVYDDLTAEHAKAVPNTTNNRMELTAVIEALKEALTDSDEPITLYSDSTYVIQGVNEWYKGWIKKNWKGVANIDLWKQFLALKANFKNITFTHIRGHAGHKENEYVDELCNNAMDNYKENKDAEACGHGEGYPYTGNDNL